MKEQKKTEQKKEKFTDKLKNTKTISYILLIMGGIALFFLLKGLFKFKGNANSNKKENEEEGGEAGEMIPSVIRV